MQRGHGNSQSTHTHTQIHNRLTNKIKLPIWYACINRNLWKCCRYRLLPLTLPPKRTQSNQQNQVTHANCNPNLIKEEAKWYWNKVKISTQTRLCDNKQNSSIARNQKPPKFRLLCGRHIHFFRCESSFYANCFNFCFIRGILHFDRRLSQNRFFSV